MSPLEIINALVVILGLPTIVGVAMYVGRKLEALDRMEKNLDEEIRPDLKDVRERFFQWEGKTAHLFQTGSPVELLERGQEVLDKSGLKAYVDKHNDEFFAFCKDNLKMKSSYDVQQSVFDYFDKLNFEKDFEKNLKEYAYQQGISLEVLRRIGAIYFRNGALQRLKMNKEDIDKKQ